MGWLSVLLGGIAGALFFKTDHMILLSLSIICAVGCFWSWGVMHNFAMELARRRSNFTGDFYDVHIREAQSVPNWITAINILFSVSSLILLIIAIIKIKQAV